MMFHNPYSYDDLKVQLQERMDERDAMRPGDLLARENSPAWQLMAQCGALLVRMGTWMQQSAQPDPRDAHISA
jgi:hypothetical protein